MNSQTPQLTRIVITGEKGGTGKSTLTALLTEYFNYINKRVQIIDTDALQIAQTYAFNCEDEGRNVSTAINPEIQIIDTAGVLGASLSYIQRADFVLVPFRAHYADLLVIIPWFTSLKKEIQDKIIFIPNYWRNTKEQNEGIEKLRLIIEEEKAGILLAPISDRPAQYGKVLNGLKENFFHNKKAEEINEIKQIVDIINK